MKPLPHWPLELALTRLVRQFVQRRPDLIARLGATAQVPIAVSPSDLPVAFVVRLGGRQSRIDVVNRDRIEGAAARIEGPLLILLGLFDGSYDGDAAFFARDITIEGQTEHVLALRNTLEEADLTPAEFVGLNGPVAEIVNRRTAQALDLARRLVGAPAVEQRSRAGAVR
ncbi:Putative lipid carrier protein-like protein [Polymorphum gilvum SL003B-26A1]|uniref:Putative lipid carrier protein-like protein n=2 Tax=Polymorphum TaxID=991903 RepID=F2J407_POLGS|nr:Putative lipid carrier protein-like protein [Polymorphum gilvum SL003B-26A1]